MRLPLRSPSAAGYGVFFAPGHECNVSIRTERQQTNNSAELQAIRHVLLIVPSVINLRIATDSRASIDAVTQSSLYNDAKWSKVANFAALKEIQSLLAARAAAGATTDFVHVYSHLLDVEHQSETDPELFARKMQKMQRDFGAEVNAMLAGNQEADQYAEIGRLSSLPLLPPLSPFDPPFVLCCKAERSTVVGDPRLPSEYVVDRMLNTVAKLSYGQLAAKYLKKYPRRSELFATFRSSYDSASVFIFRTLSIRLSSLQCFALRVSSGKLKLRSKMHDSFRDERNAELPDLHKVKALADKYSTAQCPFGCAAVEDWAHFISCPQNSVHWRAVPSLALAAINKKSLRTVASAPVWYHDRKSLENEQPLCARCPETRQIHAFPIEDGAAGFLPVGLRRWLQNNGVPGKLVGQVLTELQIIVIQAGHAAWSRRCHKLFGTLR
jgi:ribonuclease HI